MGSELLEPVFTSIENSFLRSDTDDDGQFVLGTTGGDPGTPADDDKDLMFGFSPAGGSDIWSSFPSLWVDSTVTRLEDVTPSTLPTTSGGVISTE
jgi:hypothetical protein